MIDELPVLLRFDGTHNFRDLGGYPAAGGRAVAAGRLFRSDQLSRLSDADQTRLADLGIRTVIDLRRESERQGNLDRIDDPGIARIWLPIAAEGADVQSLRRRLEDGSMTPEEAEAHLLAANREFVLAFSAEFRRFFDILLQAERYPIVFHCTAGKDRAGFAAAITLLALGASRETVFHDYLSTNACTADFLQGLLAALPELPHVKASPEAIATLLRVERAYLEQAFAAMDEHHGSSAAFMEDALGLDPERRRRLQELLLTPE